MTQNDDTLHQITKSKCQVQQSVYNYCNPQTSSDDDINAWVETTLVLKKGKQQVHCYCVYLKSFL